MEIKIDETLFNEAFTKHAVEGIKDALESYVVREQISDLIKKSAIPQILAKAIDEAIETVEISTLIQAISKQLTVSIVAGTHRVIRRVTLNTILKLKEIPSYEKGMIQKEETELNAWLDQKESTLKKEFENEND